MDGIPVNPAAPSTSEELQEAFNLFNQVSEQLTDAYRELQKQVEQLTQELAVANGELRRHQQIGQDLVGEDDARGHAGLVRGA